MNITICEDNMQIIGDLEKIVFECFNNDMNNYTCDTYLSGEELIESMKYMPMKYQIYLLDIEMKKINGLEVARYIRETDYNAVIIFITSHNELMQDAFEVNAFHFLSKPLNESKVKQVILRASEIFNIKKTLFQFKKNKRVYTLYYEDIVYFESFKRKIFLYTANKTYEFYGNLGDVLAKLNMIIFVQVHNSYIVNMDYIKKSDANYVILTNGEKISITKKYYKDFNKSYRNFVLMRVK